MSARPAFPSPASPSSLSDGVVARGVHQAIAWFQRIPYSLTALLARLSIAAVFWTSGQTKVQGFVVNLATGETHLGWPRLSNSVVALFRDEYKLPLIPPEWAAPMAATAEHCFPLLLVLGLGTRFASLALLGMTLVIEVFVYADAYPTHGTWAAVFLMLMSRGGGRFSIDHWLAGRFGRVGHVNHVR